jgi:hypothetical protein
MVRGDFGMKGLVGGVLVLLCILVAVIGDNDGLRGQKRETTATSGPLASDSSDTATTPAVSMKIPVLVKCSSSYGFVSHYYHFFFNCLVPSILMAERNPDFALRLCGSEVGSLASIYLSAIPGSKVLRECDQERNVIALNDYDHDRGVGVRDIKRIQRQMIDQHFISIGNSTREPASTLPRILLIGRAAHGGNNSHPHHQHQHHHHHHHQENPDQAYTEFTGAERRSIKNFNELDTALRTRFGNTSIVRTAYMENMTIFQQFWAFRQAKVIIGQHGAALSNIFFTTNYTKALIEISPYNETFTSGVRTHAIPNCFEVLADGFEMKYVKIRQFGEFGKVNVSNILKEVESVLYS